MRLAALLLLAALPAHGTTFTLRSGDTTVAGGEVCWTRAGGTDNPFKRWLAPPDLRCASAEGDVALPKDLLNVFARAAGFTSVPVLVRGDDAPPAMTLDVVPAATSTVTSLPAQRVVAYAPRLAGAWPVAEKTLVPAGEDLLLFVIEKSDPVAVVPVPPIEAHTERTVDVRAGGPSAVVGWLQIPEDDRSILAAARGMGSPIVRAGSRNADPIAPLEVLHGSFFRIRDVPAGPVEVSVGGRGYIPHHAHAEVSSSITAMPQPLLVRAAATLVIDWSAPADAIALDAALGSCSGARDSEPPAITVSSCPPQRPGESLDAASCTEIRKVPIDISRSFDSVTLEDIPPGFYRAELRIGKLPPVSNVANVPIVRPQHLRLRAEYFQLYGSVTLGGEPLEEDLEVRFPGGYGFAEGDRKAEYKAAVLSPQYGPDTQIPVNACDGSPRAIVITDRPMRRDTRYDIDIPANRLLIRVSDTFTREPIAGATVRYNVLSKLITMPRRVVMTRTFTTEMDGRGEASVLVQHVPDRELTLEVSRTGYETQKVPTFSVGRSDAKEVDVQLVPLRGSQGRIISGKPFESATAFWFDASGAETERAEIGSDGTFFYANEHGQGETMAVVSLSHPLWVFRTPALERKGTFSLRFPEVRAREFDVTVDRADPFDSRHIGLIIGGVRVPQPALAQHQALRRAPTTLRGRGPLHFRDLADTGAMEAILGPLAGQLAPRALAMDFFALPRFANSRKQPVPPGAGAIVFMIEH